MEEGKTVYNINTWEGAVAGGRGMQLKSTGRMGCDRPTKRRALYSVM